MNIISSYQKSGSQWTKFMIAYLKNGGPLTDWEEYDNSIPNLGSDKAGKFGWYKTHKANVIDEANHILYLIRHPLDIAVSAYRYRTMTDGARLGPVRDYLSVFIDNQGDRVFNDMNGGNWEQSVINHLSTPKVRYGFYEEMKDDYGAVYELLQGSIATEPEYVEFAYDALTEPKMREMDKINFLGKVMVGQYHDYITDEQLRAARDAFPTALDLGYRI